MVSEIFTTELILNLILDSLVILAPIFAPYIIGALVVSVIIAVVSRVVYRYNLIIGNSKRESRRKSKQAENVLNLFSSFNDISKGGM